MERYTRIIAGKVDIVKIGFLPKLIYRFKDGIPAGSLGEIDNLILKFIWKQVSEGNKLGKRKLEAHIRSMALLVQKTN